MPESSTVLKQRAIAETGCVQKNAIFLLAFAYGTSAGDFTSEFNGQTTDDIDFPVTAADLQAALEALTTIQSGGVKVTGPIGGPYHIEMQGGNAGQEVPLLLIDGGGLTPAQSPQAEMLQQGDPGSYTADADALWDSYEDSGSTRLQFLQTKLGLIEIRQGKTSSLVDTLTGQGNRVEVKESQEFLALNRLWQQTQKQIDKEIGVIQGGSRQTRGGYITKLTPNGLGYGQLAADANGILR